MKQSEKIYDVDNGIGDYTSAILENKIYSYDLDSEAACEMLKDMDISHSFSDSIRKFITECGYSGLNDYTREAVKEMKNFIYKAFTSLGEKNIIAEKTIVRWLTGESRPDNSPKSRELMFRLVFAVHAALPQATDFFLKAYYAQPFNFRNKNECIYYWCLKKNKNWDVVKEMKKTIEAKNNDSTVADSFDGRTILIGKRLNELETMEEVIAYISNNLSDEETYFRTARQLFMDLLEEAKELAEANFSELDYDTSGDKVQSKKESIGYRRQKDSVDFLLSVIFNSNDKIRPAEEWSPFIRENFPSKEQFSRCFTGKVTNADLLRKCLILLMFYITYAQDSEADFDEFYSTVNYNLENCGFPLLYPANPYDRIFMTCVYNGTEETSPLTYFRDTFYIE